MPLWVCWRINFKRLNPFNPPRLGSSAYTEDDGSTAGRESSCRVQQSHGMIGGHAGVVKLRVPQDFEAIPLHATVCSWLEGGPVSFITATVATITTTRNLKKGVP